MKEEMNENVGKKLAFHIGDYWGRKFHGNSHHPPVWLSFYPDKIVSSFRMRDTPIEVEQ